MTIYALSTGPGVSGVAIVRVSGPEASEVIKLLTKKDIPNPRMATLRKLSYINIKIGVIKKLMIILIIGLKVITQYYQKQTIKSFLLSLMR